MGNHYETIRQVFQMVISWISVAMAHLFSSETLSVMALLSSIIYSVVNVWVLLRRKRDPHD